MAGSSHVEKVPIDARLLSDAIIELNISRRNVSIYPRNHPSVDKSLRRAFDFLQKLFEVRSEITLAVAKDTVIIDDYYLDKKNPVYREFALNLSDRYVVSVTFIAGLTLDELYEFHRFLSEGQSDATPEAVETKFRALDLIHIRIVFVDYGVFAFEEGKTRKGQLSEQLWERYVYGLMEGTLQPDSVAEQIREIPPEVLARLMNRSAPDTFKEESYDQVITSYVRRSSESAFSSRDLRRLLDFINGLRPELKKQFLSSTVRTVSIDTDSAYKALRGFSVDEIMELLTTINEQKIVIPDALKNLLDRFSNLPRGLQDVVEGDSKLVDDIFLSPDMFALLSDGNFQYYVDETYQKDIQRLMDFKCEIPAVDGIHVESACSEEVIERDYNQTILEILSLDVLTADEYQQYLSMIKEQMEQFVWTGQYGQIVTILRTLQANAEHNRFPDVVVGNIAEYTAPQFIHTLVESFRVFGRHARDDAWKLCSFYGERIVPALFDALIAEDSPTIRRFFIGLLKQCGSVVLPEAIKRLGDSRWFVKRNMLYILAECNSEEVLPYIRPYCRHEHPKVSFEAVRCLLSAGDRYGIGALKDFLRSESRELVERGVALAGMYRVREVVPELVQMLRKWGIGGADLYEKIPVVKALGDIGDPRALGILREMVSARSIFFRGIAEKLKEEIYMTLKQYPLREIRDFVETGIVSKNERIREEALRLSRKAAE